AQGALGGPLAEGIHRSQEVQGLAPRLLRALERQRVLLEVRLGQREGRSRRRRWGGSPQSRRLRRGALLRSEQALLERRRSAPLGLLPRDGLCPEAEEARPQGDRTARTDRLRELRARPQGDAEPPGRQLDDRGPEHSVASCARRRLAREAARRPQRTAPRDVSAQEQTSALGRAACVAVRPVAILPLWWIERRLRQPSGPSWWLSGMTRRSQSSRSLRSG